jgi:putative FmdB family regulatory protein
MPTYDYECRKCGHRFELFHSMSDDTPKKCPKCKGRSRRVPSAGAGLLFKGSGFYITDYRSSAYQEKAKQDQSPSLPSAEAGAGSKDGSASSGAAASSDPAASGGASRPKRGASSSGPSRAKSGGKPDGSRGAKGGRTATGSSDS